MTIKASKAANFGNGKTIRVPGSKSHTIRALILATMSEGNTKITNPLKSADALSTAKAVQKIGAKVTFHDEENYWLVEGCGNNIHLPEDEIDVGNSGSLMYFISPVLATLPGRCVINGDESIQKRPVVHLTDALTKMGANAFSQKEGSVCPPFEFTGPINNNKVLITEGKLSQYISGIMMASTRLTGTTKLELTDPQETPYLSMTKYWLDKYGVESTISDDYKNISVTGPVTLKAHDVIIPSDWEAVAFPLIAALIVNENIVISDIDDSGTQGDEKIVELLKDYGADIIWDKKTKTLEVNPQLKNKSKNEKHLLNRILSVKGTEKTINMAAYPDAICALCVIACFADGKTVFTDIDICRKKETDRIVVMTELLKSLGADIEDKGDTLVINGHSPFVKTPNGIENNPEFKMHGGTVDSYLDHRVAMSLACYGLFLPETDAVYVKDAECCNVSFPGFFDTMNSSLGTEFVSADK